MSRGHGLGAPAKCLRLLGLGLLIRKMGNEFPSVTGCLGHTQLQALPALGETSLETPSLPGQTSRPWKGPAPREPSHPALCLTDRSSSAPSGALSACPREGCPAFRGL